MTPLGGACRSLPCLHQELTDITLTDIMLTSTGP